MKKIYLIIVFILIAALSGCINTKKTSGEQQLTFKPADTSLAGKIVDLKLDRDYIIAGEKVTAHLIVANTGKEKITNETVEIKVKVKSLDDFLANMYLNTLSDEQKTRTITINFKKEIEPGTVKTLSANFRTLRELQGRSLAGTYSLTIILYVNGQKVDGKVLNIRLNPGTPRNLTPTPTPAPTPTSMPTQTVTETPEPTPTPVPTQTATETPEPAVVATPTGKIVPLRVMNYRFTESDKQIDAGDEVMWNNFDDELYTIVEMDKKIANITLRSEGRAYHIFNKTGTYRFGLYYHLMRGEPSIQTIRVKLNTSQ